MAMAAAPSRLRSGENPFACPRPQLFLANIFSSSPCGHLPVAAHNLMASFPREPKAQDQTEAAIFYTLTLEVTLSLLAYALGTDQMGQCERVWPQEGRMLRVIREPAPRKVLPHCVWYPWLCS